MVFKLVISNPKDGKSYSHETDAERSLVGKRIGDQIDGKDLGLDGYTLEITGGSDQIGNPLRPDVKGPASKRLLLSGGQGFNPTRDGERRKKRVHGRTIAPDVVQINMKVIKAGGKKLEGLVGKKEAAEGEGKPAEGAKEAPKKEVKEEKAEEAPKEEVKEEKVEEAPKEEKPAEKPKEEKKEGVSE